MKRPAAPKVVVLEAAPPPAVTLSAPAVVADVVAVAETLPGPRCCSRCEGILNTNGYPLWCKACQNTYRREYTALKAEMQETRGYAAGVSAMREFLAVNFERYKPPRIFAGAEIAYIIRTCGEPVIP